MFNYQYQQFQYDAVERRVRLGAQADKLRVRRRFRVTVPTMALDTVPEKQALAALRGRVRV